MKKWTTDGVEDWLKELLKNGGQKPEDIRLRAKAAGITKGELSEARYAAGIKARAAVKINGRGVSGWLWELPSALKGGNTGCQDGDPQSRNRQNRKSNENL